ncbi:MAG: hypothetical protein A2126_02745 [Candidatus Woykebacteria bacterium GWB1_45_5]|uniref:Small-conductance mechanosensitive ion channel n=2 Tax=Candidatus Woykeibacteriota TaxID=1817899 RepID=A0A1G1W021_9BACT|nr:MAG: hypothetical protein A2113_01385 [Candidatus Woykebacteria bacterium GWA1_44_8]OGY24738.1 MAG: hypothetical protein A2126_02745 [Candidatus Woykebacteria bacterium GWB1_45_5]
MTLQDYINLSQTSLNTFFTNLGPILANIVAAIVTITIGVLVGWILKRVVEEISRATNFERALSGWPLYTKVVKSQEEMDVTTVVGELLRWIAIIVFLIPAISSLQIEGSEAVFSQLFTYLSSVIIASLYLLFGFALGWFIKRAILAVGVIVGNNPAHVVANIAYFAVVVFAAIQAILRLGVTADLIRLFVIALFLASALAFGLAGRDTAADWLKKIVEKAKG